MRNKFGGTCYRCGLQVDPGTGYFEKVRKGPGFRVQHCYHRRDGGVTCDMAKLIGTLVEQYVLPV